MMAVRSVRSLRSFVPFVVALAACTTSVPPPTQSAPVASATIAATDSPARTVAPGAASTSPAPAPAGGIEARPLGALAGEWAFVTVVARGPEGAPFVLGDVSELWAIPLAGGEPRLAIRWSDARPTGISQSNVVARQLSPDGTRIVLSVATPRTAGGSRFSLIVVELETGRATMLGRDDADSDLDPAWSPDGTRIAYRRRPDAPVGFQFDDGAWVMSADGRDVQRLVPGSQGSTTIVYGWTPDSRAVAFSYAFEEATYTVVDVTTGGRTRIGAYVHDRRGHSWRTATPAFAGSFTPSPKQTPPYLMVVDAPGGQERVLVRETDRDVLLNSVRWHPTRNELLYARGTFQARELYTLELGGSPVRLPTTGRPLEAEWWPTGNDVLYLHGGDAQLTLVSTELRTVRRDGANERAIYMPRGRAVIIDLAVRRYP